MTPILFEGTRWKWGRQRRECGLWDSWPRCRFSPSMSGRSREIGSSSTGERKLGSFKVCCVWGKRNYIWFPMMLERRKISFSKKASGKFDVTWWQPNDNLQNLWFSIALSKSKKNNHRRLGEGAFGAVYGGESFFDEKGWVRNIFLHCVLFVSGILFLQSAFIK